jgi:four helix bundle protein
MPLHIDNLVADKSYDFANRIVKAYKYLKYEKEEYILSKQLVRSGTAMNAKENKDDSMR